MRRGRAFAARPASRHARSAPFTTTLILLALALLPAAVGAAEPSGEPPAADAPHRPFVASYELRHRSMLVARTVRTLRPLADGQWVYESRTEPAGLLSAVRRDRVVERSLWRGAGADHRPRPLSYEYHHTGRSEERHVALSFDWEREAPDVTTTINGEAWRMAVPDAAQDKLLYQYTISLDLAEGAPEFVYEVADGGELKMYRFEDKGVDVLDTALGRIRAVRLERVSGSRRTVIWFSPAHHHLPVRVEQHREGRTAVMTISELSVE